MAPRPSDLMPLDFIWTLVYDPYPLNAKDHKQKIIKRYNNIRGGLEAILEEPNYVLVFKENILKILCDLNYIYRVTYIVPHYITGTH